MINKRVSTTLQVKYAGLVWFIFTSIFAVWWLINPPVAGTFLDGKTMALGVLIPFGCAGWIMNFFFMKANVLTQIADRSTRASKISLSSKKIETHAGYYPIANVSVTPIFSLFAVINRVVLACSLPFAIITLLMKGSPLAVGLMVVVAVALSWLVFALINVVALKKIERCKAVRQYSTRTVNMDYSRDMVEALCRTQKKPHFIGGWSDREDIMMALATQAIEAGFLANDLLVDGVIDPDIFDSEIKTIEYTLNAFIPNAISTTNNFFNANKKNKEAAERVYEAELEPKVISEATKLQAANKKIVDRLMVAYRKAEAVRKKNQEALIDVDKALLSLSEGAGIPIPAFPEFGELVFTNDQKKVAAKNIVTSSLNTLIEAKNKVTNSDDKVKLENQITRVKRFVKSLASNTPESAEREARLRAAIKDDPLFLGTVVGDIDDVDNTISINERYLDSYDRSLPISKK